MKLPVLFATLLCTCAAFATTHEIKMLNNGKDGIMVFEPGFLKVKKGDSVKFVPTDAAHDMSSVSIPAKAKAFKAPLNKGVTVKLTEEGVYLYECKAHITMAMVGVIQVGDKAPNLSEVEKAAQPLAATFVLNKDRLTKYLAQVQK